MENNKLDEYGKKLVNNTNINAIKLSSEYEVGKVLNLENTKKLLLINFNKLYSSIDKKIYKIDFLHLQSNGQWVGRIKIDGKYYPFIENDYVFFDMNGKKIIDSDRIHTLSNGELAGMVKFFNTTYYLPFIGKKAIEKFLGYYISDFEIDTDGKSQVLINGNRVDFYFENFCR